MSRKRDPMFQIALTANLFEWYEFSVSGFMALEIGRLFFPPTGDKNALMLSFSVFASSYLVRPIGSVFFGLWGNRCGVGASLKMSMVGMAIPASLIAFLPTYAAAGYLATALLIALKVLQGFATGGEMPLGAYYVSLHSAKKYRGAYCALVACSTFLGMLLASLVVFILPYGAALAAKIFPGSGGPLSESWRWPFLLCIPLSLWIFSIRGSIATTAAVPSSPIISTCGWRDKPMAPLLQAAALVAFMEMQVYTVFLWFPSYLHSYVGISNFDARSTNTIALVVFSVSVMCMGYATRWVSAHKLAFVGVASLVLFSYPLFAALQIGGFVVLLAVQLVFALMAACLVGVIFIVLPDLLKDNWQSLGMTVSLTLPTAIFGGTAPVVCGYLIERSQLLTAPALYIVVMGLVALPVAYRLAFRELPRGLPA
jgi:MHS family proline/betaine transporter-like MFS transporter